MLLVSYHRDSGVIRYGDFVHKGRTFIDGVLRGHRYVVEFTKLKNEGFVTHGVLLEF